MKAEIDPSLLQQPAIAILRVGQTLAEALQLPDQIADAKIAEQARTSSQLVPTREPLVPDTGRLPFDQAVIVLTYAVSALAQGRAADSRRCGQIIGRFLGLPASDLDIAVPAIVVARAGDTLDVEAALAAYFDPAPPVRSLAKTIALKLDVRRHRRLVSHIAPQDYEHPDDRRALAAVRSVTGVELALRKLSEIGAEKAESIENLASCVRVGSNQFPELYALFCEAVAILGMPRVPELFVKSMGINAYTLGVESPRVVLSYIMPGLFTRDELLFIIGHELGHIRSGHAPFIMLRRFLPQLAELIGQMTLGIGTIVGVGMQAVLLDWYRKSEMTCDRCGLLVCQNPDAALSALMKLAGAPTVLYRQMNLDAFIEQAKDYDRLDTSVLSKLYKLGYALENDHPWTAVRARELLRWIRGGDYERLLSAAAIAGAQRCAECGRPIAHEDVFCSACGARVAPATERELPT